MQVPKSIFKCIEKDAELTLQAFSSNADHISLAWTIHTAKQNSCDLWCVSYHHEKNQIQVTYKQKEWILVACDGSIAFKLWFLICIVLKESGSSLHQWSDYSLHITIFAVLQLYICWKMVHWQSMYSWLQQVLQSTPCRGHATHLQVLKCFRNYLYCIFRTFWVRLQFTRQLGRVAWTVSRPSC